MPNQRNNINTVIFDMDGVITNTMPFHYKAWVEAMRPVQVPVTRHDVYIREGQPGINFVWDMSSAYDRSFTVQQAKQILANKEDIFKQIVRMRYFPGARSLIRRLHKSGYKLGLVTGTSRHEMERMLPDALKKQFDVIVTGSDIKQGKPHPDPFLRAVKMLKSQKTKTIVIENAPFGIRAAKRAGLMCFAVESYLDRRELKGAHKIFKNIQSVSKYIQ